MSIVRTPILIGMVLVTPYSTYLMNNPIPSLQELCLQTICSPRNRLPLAKSLPLDTQEQIVHYLRTNNYVDYIQKERITIKLPLLASFYPSFEATTKFVIHHNTTRTRDIHILPAGHEKKEFCPQDSLIKCTPKGTFLETPQERITLANNNTIERIIHNPYRFPQIAIVQRNERSQRMEVKIIEHTKKIGIIPNIKTGKELFFLFTGGIAFNHLNQLLISANSSSGKQLLLFNVISGELISTTILPATMPNFYALVFYPWQEQRALGYGSNGMLYLFNLERQRYTPLFEINLINSFKQVALYCDLKKIGTLYCILREKNKQHLITYSYPETFEDFLKKRRKLRHRAKLETHLQNIHEWFYARLSLVEHWCNKIKDACTLYNRR